MIAHVLGWLTIALTFATGSGVVQWLRVAVRDATQPWLKPLPIPKFADVPLALSTGSDWVGLV